MSMLLNNKRCIKRGFFVAGTDTGVGKTLVAASISLSLVNIGKNVSVMKPIASGCYKKDGQLVNNDGLILRECSTNKQEPYSSVNPFAFQEPIAPHIAAQKRGIKLSVQRVLEKSQPVLTSDSDYVIIEGVGGWLTPINDLEDMANLACEYGYPIILVVGIRLAAISYALLTYNHMRNSGIKIAGWVANIIDQHMICAKENIATIKHRIDSPLLGIIPYIT